MLFFEEPDVKESKLIRKYLNLEIPDFRDKKFLLIDSKTLNTFLFRTLIVLFKVHLEYLHPGAQLWFNVKLYFIVNDGNSRHDSVRR